MKRNREFLAPGQITDAYPEIVATYQEAFAGDPWYEVSKCPGCESGYSVSLPSTTCEVCGDTTSGEAYPSTELTRRFDQLGATRPTSWYTERDNEGRIVLAGIAWRASVAQIAEEKYADVPAMDAWLARRYQALGARATEIIWVDEVFANRRLSPSGNLWNFPEMIDGFAARLGGDVLAYRTINPAMITAPKKAFGSAAAVAEARLQVPDRRNFVSIIREKEEV